MMIESLYDNDDDEDVRLPLDNCLFMSQRSQEEARPGLELLEHDEAGLRGFLSFLCASHSHLSTESARPGMGLGLEAKEAGRMMRHGFICGVGRRPGRRDAAALAIARSTENIGDLSWRFDFESWRLGRRRNRRSDGWTRDVVYIPM